MSIFEKLDRKIDELLDMIEKQKEDNQMLRGEIVALKAECEIKNTEISRLEKLNAEKQQEIEGVEKILNKLESMG